jgi:dipeptidyl aminopeptidase/acylaminoacyl peptidase
VDVKRLAAAAALLLAACSRPEPAAGLGHRVVEARAEALRPSPDGQFLAWLDGCAPLVQRGVPPGTSVCDLRAAPVDGGDPVRVARGVTTLPGSFAWSGEGHVLAALEGFDLGAGAGQLVAWTPGGAPRPLGEGVSFWAFAPRGRLLAFAWRGQLHLWRPGGEAEPVEGATGVASFAFHPQGEAGTPLLLARRGLQAGGQLLAIRPGSRPVVLGGPAGDYGYAPAGDRIAFTERSGDGHDLHLVAASAPVPAGAALGEGVSAFAFSRDGRGLAWLAGVAPGRQGDLYVLRGDLRPERLARGVGEMRWARDGARLAWLEQYDPRVRAGTLATGTPGQAPQVLGRNVSAYDLSPDGRAIAFLEHVIQGGYSVDLRLARLGAGVPVETLARGVFGFDFAPDGQRIWYRSACTRSAEACDLFAVGPAPGDRPQRMAEGVKSFEFDPRDPGRLLLGWSRQDRVALDLGLWQGGKVTAIDRSAVPGSASFLGPDSRRLAYLVGDPKRPGVYVAELPR